MDILDFLKNHVKEAIFAVIGLVLLVMIIRKRSQIIKFLIEVKVELGKVAWSTKEELFASTIVVIVTTSIMAVYLFIIDGALTRFLSALFK
jgi:preprotein translocase subunit SecE